MMSTLKKYKWIIALAAVVVVCAVGRYVRDRYDTPVVPEGMEQVDVVNAGEELLEADADDGREEYIFKVNINTATAEELCTLPSIGESTAGKIIEFREEYGGFNGVQEIMLVSGIGEKTFEKISKYLVIE